MTPGVVFVVVGALGLVLMAIGLIFGGLLDLFDVTGGLLSLAPVGAALAIFGAVGVIMLGSGAEAQPAYVIGGAAGVLSLGIGAVFTRYFQRISSGSTVDYTLVGRTAIVTSDVDETGGEVHVEDSRESGRRLATSAEILTEGTRVRVIGHTGSSLRVAPYVVITESSSSKESS
ncbi:NfeD family protein [Subtercola frigoramans]|uniref:Membrane protein implicated in regulation of membrane protease activity n=1 Tax=Subtercola frigoramans TaxID=120298 RepID=A0ABS2L728_9MICO|nr:NfeD family protein [Subtercola frigoramans]MBM7472686.1 membrane protein implicated in regulation of membrane protease activity [Subtercola frigoramans]